MATFVLKTAGHCRVATEDCIATIIPRLPCGSPFAEGTHEDCDTPQTRL